MGARGRFGLVLWSVFLGACPAFAQQGTDTGTDMLPAGTAVPGAGAADAGGGAAGVPQSAVVVLDRDVLYASSLFGRRVGSDIDAASISLAQENKGIEIELEAEERALTERREGMDRSQFRQLAAEFDTRVTGIRQAQDAKTRAIAQQGERAQALFFEAANPILVMLARETGALVILDRRMVIASADQVDITVLARERIDAELGEGEGLRQAPPPQRPDAPAPPVSAPAPATEQAAKPETVPETLPDPAQNTGPDTGADTGSAPAQ